MKSYRRGVGPPAAAGDDEAARRERYMESVSVFVDNARSLKAVWSMYRVTVVPAGASEERVAQIYMAFMASADWIFGQLLRLSDGPEDEAVAFMDGIRTELMSLHKGLGAGFEPEGAGGK